MQLIWIPSGVGAETNIPNVVPAGMAHWLACQSNDGDTSYVYIASGNYRDLYAISGTAGAGVINWIRPHIVCMGAASYAKAAYRFGGAAYEGIQNSLGAAYVDYDYGSNITTRPTDGNPWQWADIPNLQIGVHLTYGTGAKDFDKCTYCYLVIDYTPPTNYKDIPTRFKLTVRGYKDIPTRFLLTVQSFRDIPTRFKLTVLGYTDTPTRFILIVQNWVDIHTRFLLWVQNYVDIPTRFYLVVQNYADTHTRFRLIAQSFIDIDTRFLLTCQGYSDTATRFYLVAPSAAWHEWMFESDDYVLQGRPQAAHFRL